MTKDELLQKIDEKLDYHFPDVPHPTGPYWHQRPYLDDLFDLSIRAYGIVRCDDVALYVRTYWAIRRKHIPPSDVQRQIDLFVDAWGEWQFAYQKLSAAE